MTAHTTTEADGADRGANGWTDESDRDGRDGDTIPIVDDEEGLADLFAIYFDDGDTTRTAYDGSRRSKRSMRTSMSCCWTDACPNCPVGVLATLRGRGYEQPVTLLTAIDPGTEMLEMDIEEYPVKPIGEAALRAAVESLLARTRFGDVNRTRTTVQRRLLDTDGDGLGGRVERRVGTYGGAIGRSPHRRS